MNGLFTVIPGESVTLPYSVFDNTTLYLGIKVDSDPEMTPRQRLTSAPYAMTAPVSGSEGGWVADGSIVRLETSSDKVEIGVGDPHEPLVVGEDLGTFAGDWIVIGSFARAIVEQEIQDNQFVIATDEPNVKVSWQVTGIRQDPLAQSRRVKTVRDKPVSERGLYGYAEAYGLSPDKSVNYKLREETRRNNHVSK